MPVPDSSADLENSETAPLLAPELPSQRLINSCGKINKRICLLSIAGISAALLIMTGIVGYFVVIPNAIQSAIHGTGSHVTMVRIVSIKPEAVQVQLDLNMPLKQVSPLDSSMQESQMILSSVKESVFYPEIPIGSLQLPTIHIPANTHQLVVNLSTTVENINAAWVSHFFRQSVFHGLPLTHLKATSRPQVSISHLGSWPAILLREYSLDPNMPVAVNYTELAPSVSNVKYRTEPKPEGLKYIVDATAHFTNVYSIALDPQGMDLHAEIVYLGVPILAAVAYNPALTKKNAIMVHFESFAENSKQLMQLVGDIAAGETVKVTVRNVLVTGKSYGWIQDMLKGLAFTVDIPKIPKGVQEAVQESVEAAKAIKWMQDAISAIGIHIMLTP